MIIRNERDSYCNIRYWENEQKSNSFNEDFKIVSEVEEKFAETIDDDGFECDDIEHIEIWVKESLMHLA